MNKLLVAGVAALAVLTASAASTKPLIKWQCGRTLVILHESSFGAERHSVTIEFKPAVRRNYSFEWNADFERKWVDEPNPGQMEVDYGVATGDEAWLNGKRCKDYVPSKKPRGEQPK
jgi:hypothetical protein